MDEALDVVLPGLPEEPCQTLHLRAVSGRTPPRTSTLIRSSTAARPAAKGTAAQRHGASANGFAGLACWRTAVRTRRARSFGGANSSAAALNEERSASGRCRAAPQSLHSRRWLPTSRLLLRRPSRERSYHVPVEPPFTGRLARREFIPALVSSPGRE